MILISKRGNLVGPNPNKENTVKYIKNALDYGLHVEIDVRTKDDELYLGHDIPQEKIEESWLENPKFFVHCKDKQSYDRLKQNKKIKCFMQNDDTEIVTKIDNSDLYWANASFHPIDGVAPKNIFDYTKTIIHESYKLKGEMKHFVGVYGDNLLKGQLTAWTITDPAIRLDTHYAEFQSVDAWLQTNSTISQNDAFQKLINILKMEI